MTEQIKLQIEGEKTSYNTRFKSLKEIIKKFGLGKNNYEIRNKKLILIGIPKRIIYFVDKEKKTK